MTLLHGFRVAIDGFSAVGERLHRPISMQPLSPASSLRAFWTIALVVATPVATALPMGEADARHLLARTGFGPTTTEVRTYASLSRSEAIERLLSEVKTEPLTSPPVWLHDAALFKRPAQMTTAEERKAFQQSETRRAMELRGWWIREMLVTPSPLTERMALFWHNHFVSGEQKVRDARMMYAQNALFRTQALGSFATLLHAVGKDPAMVVYLDNARNRKGAPNENFAREVMELFTLGQGHYTEDDIKEAARAFTGWSVDRASGAFAYRPRLHDDGQKTVFGKTGAFDGDAVLDLILERRETAEFIVAKLWKEFVSPTPDPHIVASIACDFRASQYGVKVALRDLLETNAFWARENRGTLVKSPVEIVVGALRQLDVSPDETVPLALVLGGMGQNLFGPPNVRGWPGGDAWINSSTLLARKQFLDRIAHNDAGAPPRMAAIAMTDRMFEPGDEPAPTMATREATVAEVDRASRIARQIDRSTRKLRFEAVRWIGEQDGNTRAGKMEAAKRLLLPIDPQLPASDDTDVTAAVAAALLDPAYQLK
ncbi:MAG TPA: DUF1800 domain-containing protein [Casimicrobiaceae bacterium]